MATVESQNGLKASIIDRLIDPDSDGTTLHAGYSADMMADSVRRDLEDLLNTHLASDEVPREYVEVRNSIVAFGLPDLVSQRATGPDAAARVKVALELAIAQFEPRLTDVNVKVVNVGSNTLMKLEFEIRAVLRVDPAPEVTFLTVLKLSTGEATIQKIGN
jgi:type VI secretion system protein ImpF